MLPCGPSSRPCLGAMCGTYRRRALDAICTKDARETLVSFFVLRVLDGVPAKALALLFRNLFQDCQRLGTAILAARRQNGIDERDRRRV